MHELFRRGEVLPEGRSNRDEVALIEGGEAELARSSVRQCLPLRHLRHGTREASQTGV